MAKSISIAVADMKDFCASSSNLYTLATNALDVDATHVYMNVTSQASGTDLSSKGTLIAGDNVDILDVKPPYIPYMVEGAFFCGLTDKISNADMELSDYQFIDLFPSTGSLFLVWGICSTTQTQFYTPELMDNSSMDAVVWKTNFTKKVRS